MILDGLGYPALESCFIAPFARDLRGRRENCASPANRCPSSGDERKCVFPSFHPPPSTDIDNASPFPHSVARLHTCRCCGFSRHRLGSLQSEKPPEPRTFHWNRIYPKTASHFSVRCSKQAFVGPSRNARLGAAALFFRFRLLFSPHELDRRWHPREPRHHVDLIQKPFRAHVDLCA